VHAWSWEIVQVPWDGLDKFRVGILMSVLFVSGTGLNKVLHTILIIAFYSQRIAGVRYASVLNLCIISLKQPYERCDVLNLCVKTFLGRAQLV
jgi:hypothetical protein